MSESQDFDGEVVEGVEVYDGPPDHTRPVTNENGDQDDEVALGGGIALFAKPVATVRTTEEALAWYATHQTANQIGFDPDGMCLKICRTARNIGPKWMTAAQARDNTPAEYRVAHVRDLRKGMVLYFGDPDDNNAADHIVTLIGRVPNFDKDNLGDLLVETNSVVSDQVVVVRGDYFLEHWGDKFQFGATFLNGVAFPKPEKKSKIERFKDGGPVYKLNLLSRAGKDRPAAKNKLDAIMTQVNQLPDSPQLERVREFKNKVRSGEKLLDMGLLDKAVEARGNRDGKIKKVRDEIRRLIASLPDE